MRELCGGGRCAFQELQGAFWEWTQSTILFLPASGERSTSLLTGKALGHVWLICYKVIKNCLSYCSTAWSRWNKQSGWRWVEKLGAVPFTRHWFFCWWEGNGCLSCHGVGGANWCQEWGCHSHGHSWHFEHASWLAGRAVCAHSGAPELSQWWRSVDYMD